MPQLLRAGGSPGGARPKVLVGVRDDELISGESDLPPDFEPWLIKFPAEASDRDDHAKNFAFLIDDKGEWTLTPATTSISPKAPAASTPPPSPAKAEP